MSYRLGIDLGTNSLGWCALSIGDDGNPTGILDIGSRIFSNSRHPKTGVSNAVARRLARSMRRQRERKLRKTKTLINELIRQGLFPSNKVEKESLKNLDPYMLRSKALDEKLTPFELGRAIHHLSKRRGFKSNRKGDKETKTKEFLEGIENLKRKLSSKRSVGELLYHEGKDNPCHVKRFKEEQHLILLRDMVESEFDLIINKQKEFHNFNSEKIKNIIFYQRPLKSKEDDIGRCEIFSDYKRHPICSPLYQLFRIIQQISDLKIEKNAKLYELSLEQKESLFRLLVQKKEVSFDDIRILLKNDSSMRFNIESERRTAIKGDVVSPKLFRILKYSTLNASLEEILSFYKTIDDIVFALVDCENDDDIRVILSELKLSDQQIDKILKIDTDKLPANYCSFSKKALIEVCEKTLNDLSLHPTSTIYSLVVQTHSIKKIYDELPVYGDFLEKETIKRIDGSRRVSNPTVHCGMVQIYKVVNQIINKHGKPESVIIELARDLKMNKKQKNEYKKSQKEKHDLNEEIRKELKENGYDDNKNNMLKMRLWKNNVPIISGAHVSPYCGKTISFHDLFDDGVIEIDHILPYSRTLDDSISNKTLAFTKVNQDKKNRSPFEAWGKNKHKYEGIIDRIKTLPYNIRKRFFQDAMERFLDENLWAASQLNDTRYLSKLAKKYFESILPANKIFVTKGGFTSAIRYSLGLNQILALPGVDVDKKNRDDHRHHAVDALVIALSSLSFLCSVRKNIEKKQFDRLKIEEPWENFRGNVTGRILSIITDHKVDHSYQNAFFEDTAYGCVEKSDEYAFGKFNLIERVSVEKIFTDEKKKNPDKIIEKIKDIRLRTIGDTKGIDALEEELKKTKTKKLRMYKSDSSAIEVKFQNGIENKNKTYVSQGNYQLQIWETEDGTWYYYAVSYYEANIYISSRLVRGKIKYISSRLDNYVRNKIIDKKSGLSLRPNSKKVMTLFKGDTVLVNDRYWIIVSIRPSKGNECIALKDVNNPKADIIYPKFNSFKELGIRLARIK